jgi:outer membrane protein
MKKLSLILNVVILLAVIVLFVLHFTGKDSVTVNNEQTPVENLGPAKGIAFVEIDTILMNFDLYSDLSDELLTKQENAEAELTAKGRNYESGALDYQDKVNKGLVTRATAAQMEQSLLQEQQNLVNLRDQLQYELMEEEQVMNRRVLEYVYVYLEEYTLEHNYDYILGKTFGSPVMYSNNTFDITSQVLEGLNKKYQAEK